MAETTQMVRDDAYDDMGASYQCVQVAVLDKALKMHGILDAEIRQQVCRTFLFEMGNLHDQGWLKANTEGPRLYPLLCFTTRFLNLDTPVDELGVVYATGHSFSYHEYALGSADLYYEGDPAAQVETGCFEEKEE